MTQPIQSQHGEFRELKATITGGEFGAVQWAAKRAGANHKAIRLDEFLKRAVMDAVRAVVRAEIARGKAIPPNVAAVIGSD